MEEWRPIPGYEGWYEASDQGRVRSVDRLIVDSRGRRYQYPSVVLKPKVRKDGYLEVALRRNGHALHKRVHQLTMLAFVGPPPPGMEVRHLDRNRSNNVLSNLSYGTHLDNMSDRALHGTHRNAVKTHCSRGHLLTLPNLVVSHLPIRDCLSCARALSSINGMRLRGRTDLPDVQSVADDRYVKLGFTLI